MRSRHSKRRMEAARKKREAQSSGVVPEGTPKASQRPSKGQEEHIGPTPERVAKGDIKRVNRQYRALDEIERLFNYNLLGMGRQAFTRYEAGIRYRFLVTVCEESRQTLAQMDWSRYGDYIRCAPTMGADEYLIWVEERKKELAALRKAIRQDGYFGKAGLDILDMLISSAEIQTFKDIERLYPKRFAHSQAGRILQDTLDVISKEMGIG